MTIESLITDPETSHSAKVTRFGQLVVAPIDYSTPIANELIVPGQVVNFIGPQQDQQIVITDIIASADKNVNNTTPADVVIYEASADDTDVADEIIIRPQLLRASNFPLTGLNLLVPPGKWVNATTTDGGILLTIMFYRVPVERFK